MGQRVKTAQATMTKECYTFIGEQRSERAKQLGLVWEDGGLAAKQLFDALQICGIDPGQQHYFNVYMDDGSENKLLKRILKTEKIKRFPPVAMGEKAHQALVSWCIPHLRIIHPAARGRIRRKDRYAAHVQSVLEGRQ